MPEINPEDAKFFGVSTKKAPEKPRSLWKRFKDGVFEGAASNYIGVRGARSAIESLITGGTEDTDRRAREYKRVAQEGRASDEEAFKDVDTLSPANIGKHGVDLLGNIVGGVDPTYILGPGKTLVTKALSQAGINLGVDSVNQGVDIARGEQEGWDTPRSLINTAAGVVIGPGGELIARRLTRGKAKSPKAKTKINPEDAEFFGVEAPNKGGAAAASNWILPVNGGVNSPFGKRKAPRSDASSNHQGVDLAGEIGDPVQAPVSGTVSNVGRGHNKRGNWVEITGEDGTTHRFLHLSGFNVKRGQKVNQGDLFGRVGATGNVTGPHLHWSVKAGGEYVDPMSYTGKDGKGSTGDSVDPMNPRDMAEAMGDEDMLRALDEEGRMTPEEEDILRMADDSQEPLKTRTPDNVIDFDEAGKRVQEKRLEEYRGDWDRAIEDNIVNADRIYDEVDSGSVKADDVVTRPDGTQRTYAERVEDVIDRLEEIQETADLTPSQYTRINTNIAKLNEALQNLGAPLKVPRWAESSHEKYTAARVPVRSAANDVDEVSGKLSDQDESGSLTPDGSDGANRPPSGPTDGGPTDGGPTDGGIPDSDPVIKIKKALKNLQQPSKEQRRLYRQARKVQNAKLEQIAEKGGDLRQMNAALKGELPHVDYASIRDQFTPEEIKLFKDYINSNNKLTGFDKRNAHEALENLLGKEGTRLPTNSQKELLEEIFGDDILEGLFPRTVANILNVPRAIMASADVSAPFRQGIVMIGRKEFYTSMPDMLKSYGSKDVFEAVQLEIRENPYYRLFKEHDLALTLVGKDARLMDREEAFMTRASDHIPIIKQSNRAYVAYLNKLRADVASSILTKWKDAGVDIDDPKMLKALFDYINTATGRGSLGSFNRSAPLLNSLFFSTRLIASRFKLLNPLWYAKLYKADPQRLVFKEAVKDVSKFAMAAGTALSLAMLAGAEVEWDPSKPDGLKVKINNSRIDVSGGIVPWVRLYTNIGKFVNDAYVRGEEDKSPFRQTASKRIGKFLRNKESPVASLIHDFLDGQTAIGEKFDTKEAVISRMTPMISQSAWELYLNHSDEAGPGGLVLLPFEAFGMSVMTYKEKEKKEKKKDKKEDAEFFGVNNVDAAFFGVKE